MNSVVLSSGNSFIVHGRGAFREKRFHSGSEAALYAAKKSMAGHGLVLIDVVEAPRGAVQGSLWKTFGRGAHRAVQTLKIFVEHRPKEHLASFGSVDPVITGYRISSRKLGSGNRTMVKDLGRAFKEAIWGSLRTGEAAVIWEVSRDGNNRSPYTVSAEQVQ